MAGLSSSIEDEAKSWLGKIFPNLQNLSLVISGQTEKGVGYVGDILFVDVSGSDQSGLKDYHVVLKCSKRSPHVREQEKFKNLFVVEISFYEEVLPKLIQFQESKNIDGIFQSVPLCYGTIMEENVEVIVLENMRKSGYELWSRKEPLLREHINLVIREYAKLHATSVAFKIQEPEKFQRISDILKPKLGNLLRGALFKKCLSGTVDLFRDEFDCKAIQLWENLIGEVEAICAEADSFEGFKVILHGDCWTNNFMFKYGEDRSSPSQVVILDWQLLRYSSPIFDLSYFLFCCISESDIENLDEILQQYYENFSSHLLKFGIDASSIYSQEQFFKDWKKYLKFGLIFAMFLHKMCVVDKEEVMDIAEIVENSRRGDHFLDRFKDKYNEAYKNRIRFIINYVLKNNLI